MIEVSPSKPHCSRTVLHMLVSLHQPFTKLPGLTDLMCTLHKLSVLCCESVQSERKGLITTSLKTRPSLRARIGLRD